MKEKFNIIQKLQDVSSFQCKHKVVENAMLFTGVHVHDMQTICEKRVLCESVEGSTY